MKISRKNAECICANEAELNGTMGIEEAEVEDGYTSRRINIPEQ